MLTHFLYLPMPAIYLFVIAFLFRKMPLGKILSFIAFLILLIGALPATEKVLSLPLHRWNSDLLAITQFAPDAILVPSAGAERIGVRKQTPGTASMLRSEGAMALQEELNIPVIISGGDPNKHGISEAEILGNWHDWPSDTILENEAVNTFENAARTAIIMEQKGWRRLVVATDFQHLPRMLAALSAQDIQARGIATSRSIPSSLEAMDFVPDVSSYSKINYLIHELLGLLYYQYAGYISFSDIFPEAE